MGMGGRIGKRMSINDGMECRFTRSKTSRYILGAWRIFKEGDSPHNERMEQIEMD